jgi:Tol biopolymer transport system component
MLVCAAPADAAFPGANGKIAFSSNSEVYVMNPDGTGPVNVTNNPSFDANPAWSPDGMKLAFTSGRDGDAEIYVMAADGSGVTQLTNNATWDSGPAWSPDGTKIAFVTDRDGDFELYVMGADGSNPTRLTNAAGTDSQPAWSPDGSQIAFASNRLDPRLEYYRIYTMNADGTGALLRTTGDDTSPSWSPDGGKIAYSRSQTCPVPEESRGDVLVMNRDGSGQTNVTNVGCGINKASPAWSPSGDRIAFTSGCTFLHAGCESRSDIYVMKSDGSEQTNLTNASANYEPDWQPIVRNYPRPKGAGSIWVSLVPAYRACASSNSTHGAPLAAPSCAPPVPLSGYLTVGTADSNGKPTKSNGSLLAEVVVGNPATAADEADVKLTFELKDVRKKADLFDYAGELLAVQGLRITDRYNGYGGGAATTQDLSYNFTVPCAATEDTTIGASCSLATTADTLVPGAIKEGKRAIWDLGQLHVFDGGADGLAATADNTLFEVQGIFVP